MNISFFDMKKEAEELLAAGLMNDIEQVIKSGQYLFGPKSKDLEEHFTNYFGQPAALVGSGTDALALSLKALGVGPGDKVAIPAMTAIPTAVAVKMVGAEVIYVEINGSTFTMSESALEGVLLEEDVKAIIVVHLYGNAGRLLGIQSLCSQYGVPLIEDCAQSFGSKYHGKLTGLFGCCGAFSFYPSKNLGAYGDAGLVISKEPDFIDKIKQLRFYGQSSRYKMGDMWGINSRIDEIQATILLKKIQFIKEHLIKREELCWKYFAALKGKFQMPLWLPGAVPHLFPILVENRDNLIAYLKLNGIETAIHYPFYLEEEMEKTDVVSCPRAKEYSQKVLSIPFHPWLTDEEVNYIIGVLLNYK